MVGLSTASGYPGVSQSAPLWWGPHQGPVGQSAARVEPEASQSAPPWWGPHQGPAGLSTVRYTKRPACRPLFDGVLITGQWSYLQYSVYPGASQSGPPWSGTHNGKVDVSTASVYPGASQLVPPRWGPHRGPEGLSTARPGSVQGSASRPLHRWGSLFFIHNKYCTVYIILLFNGGKILRRQKLCWTFIS